MKTTRISEPFFKNLDDDITKWDKLNRYTPEGPSGGKSSAPVKGFWSRMTYGTGNKELNQLTSSLNDTKKLIRNLSYELSKDTIDSSDLNRALVKLGTLKEKMIRAANTIYPRMKQNYIGELAKNGVPITTILENEQEEICDKLVPEIEKAIFEFGPRLQAQLLADKLSSKQNEAVKTEEKINQLDAFIEESFQILDPTDRPPPNEMESITEEQTLEDKELESKWEIILAQTPDLEPDLRKKPAEISREFLKGVRANIELVEVENNKNEKVLMPNQLSRDLPRMTEFKVNGKIVFLNSQTFKYDSVSAYKELIKACSKTKNEAIDTKVAERIGRMLDQGMLAEFTHKIRIIAASEEAPVHAYGQNLIYSVHISSQKVIITMKINFKLTNENNLNAFPEAILVKRVIEIPLKELQEQDIESQSLPLPGMKAYDKFSKRIDNPDYASTLLDSF